MRWQQGRQGQISSTTGSDAIDLSLNAKGLSVWAQAGKVHAKFPPCPDFLGGVASVRLIGAEWPGRKTRPHQQVPANHGVYSSLTSPPLMKPTVPCLRPLAVVKSRPDRNRSGLL